MTSAPASSAPAAASSQIRFGLICGVSAYTLWGLFPLYIKLLSFAGPAEIVAHRIVWSVPFGAFILSMRGQWRETFAAARSPRIIALLGVAAFFIALNWLIYVWAVANDRVLQASLGYYINPLVFIAAGVFFLKEKLSRLQIAAVILAAAGVSVLTFGAGVFPWPSFVLAFSFTMYGLVRKTTAVGAMPGLFIETVILSPAALIFLMWLQSQGTLALGRNGFGHDILLFLAGPVTVGPLVLFALAARRLTLTTLGFLQYIGPTGQFFLGLYYGEKFTLAHAVCFGSIWAALALISFDAVRRNRKAAKPVAA
ncbi:MAG: EamA family transporter RarD [Parvularculaceae bacterium]|nr:EamA family transporter RarD [Parvularculaceae bacterium]